jgi:hypothetical protein
MCKWLIRTTLTLALVMNILTPTRFATTSLCNHCFFKSQSHPVQIDISAEHLTYHAPDHQHKTSARDFSIVAGLEIGNDSLAVLLGSPIRLQQPVFLKHEQHSCLVSESRPLFDILTLHSRRNI